MAKIYFDKNQNNRIKIRMIIVTIILTAAFLVFENKDIIFKKEVVAQAGYEDQQSKKTEKVEKTLEEALTQADKNKEVNAAKETKNVEKPTTSDSATTSKESTKYAVVSSNPVASAVAMKVLEDGGNAVDAAVALSFALNVTDPQNSGIGGGGGMLIYNPKDQNKVFYDYYISSGDKEPIGNIGIPGFLKGLEKMSQDLGTIEFSKLLDYPLALAEKGVFVTKGYADILARFNYIRDNYDAVLRPDGNLLQEGDIFIQKDLINTMKEIQKGGSDVFYGGQHQISQDFLALTGISPESLAAYEVKVSKPLEAQYMGYNVLAPQGPFSGLTLIENLILEENLLNIGKHNIKDKENLVKIRDLYRFTAHEARMNTFDHAFGTVDYPSLLNKANILQRYHSYEGEKEFYDEPETESTTAFSVIDKDGMVVSGTNTISNYWGSYVVQNGIIFNNAMKNFSDGANKFAYNKRPKTGIAPAIIYNDKGHIEALGANGGAKIPFYETMFLVNSIKHNMDPQDANDLERIFYLKGLMHFEKNAPITSIDDELDVAFDDEFVLAGSSTAWGIMNGIIITPEGEITTHYDTRNYFDGGGTYYNDGQVFPQALEETAAQ